MNIYIYIYSHRQANNDKSSAASSTTAPPPTPLASVASACATRRSNRSATPSEACDVDAQSFVAISCVNGANFAHTQRETLETQSERKNVKYIFFLLLLRVHQAIVDERRATMLSHCRPTLRTLSSHRAPPATWRARRCTPAQRHSSSVARLKYSALTKHKYFVRRAGNFMTRRIDQTTSKSRRSASSSSTPRLKRTTSDRVRLSNCFKSPSNRNRVVLERQFDSLVNW